MKKQKFLIKNDDTLSVLGLSYNTNRRLLVAGGPGKYKDEFSETIYEAFTTMVDWNESGGRVKTKVRITPTVWRVGLERLGEAGFIIERVKSFRRLMN